MANPTDPGPGQDRADASPWRSSIGLYNAFAADYDASFEAPNHRNAYDLLAWEHLCRLLPPPPALIVDAGCGTGRWVGRLLSRGHRVVGIEQAPEMIKVLEERGWGPDFTLLPESMETANIAAESADLVLAIGSVQYTRDPARMIRRFASWTKPGGCVCVLVDSLLSLILELLQAGKTEEALLRLQTGQGVFTRGDHSANLYLPDRRTLESYFAGAGLTEVSCHGLLVTNSAWGRERCLQAIASDATAVLDLERRLSRFPVLADAGKHIFASARRPL